MLYKEAFKHISSTQLLHWMGDLEKLLLFAEDIAVEAALDVERVRVCLPPSGFDDSILLLDSIDQVPPDEIWESLNSFIEQKYTTVHSLANGGCSTESYSSSQQKSDHIDSSEPAPIPSPDVNLPENEIFALEGSPERELEPKVLFSPMIEEMMESEQDTDHKCLDRLSLELDSATEDEKPQLATPERGNMCDSETLCVGHSVLDTAVSSTEVPRTSAALASNTHSMDFQSIITAYRPRIEFFGPPQRVLEDTCYSGDVVYYWVTQTFRVRDNLALAAAMRLSAELCVPLVAIVSANTFYIAAVSLCFFESLIRPVDRLSSLHFP